MSWRRTTDTDRRIEWEREDGCAALIARRTATGDWAVTLDRLEQAPEGETYAHETTASRETAVELAERWTDEHDTE